MRYLFTPVVLWWTDGAHLSARARDLIADESNDIDDSAASAWAIATEHRLGKLPKAG